MLSFELPCSGEFVMSFGITGDDMSGFVRVGVGALSRYVASP